MSIRLALALLVAASPALAADAPDTEVTWFGHAAFIVKTPKGTTLAIDPWFTNPKAPKGVKPPTKIDAILVTHGHDDHVGEAVALAASTGAKVLGSFELANLIGAKNSAGGNAGGSVRIGDALVHYVEAVHSSSFGEKRHYAGAPLGYVIEIDDGPTLYHAGDTGEFSSMALIAERFSPRVAMLPIGGHFTMDPAGAAIAAKMLGARTIIPIHYGTFPVLTGTPDELKAQIGKTAPFAKVQVAVPGQPMKFRKD